MSSRERERATEREREGVQSEDSKNYQNPAFDDDSYDSNLFEAKTETAVETGEICEEEGQGSDREKRFSFLPVALILTLAAAALAYPYFHFDFFPSPEVIPVVVDDFYHPAEIEKITATFNSELNKGAKLGVPASIENTEVQETIIEIYGVDDGVKIIEDAKAGATEIVMLSVFDNLEQDGDIIRLKNSLIDVTVPIWHEFTTVAIPVTPEDQTIEIYGHQDGGGGVTVGAYINSDTAFDLPPIEQGYFYTLPLKCVCSS